MTLQRSCQLSILFLLTLAATNGQTTFGDEVRVNDDPAGERQIAPQLALAPGGIVYVIWTDFRSRPDGEIYLASSVDGGRVFETPRPLSIARGALAGLQRGAQFVVDRAGVIHMIWQERTSRGKISAVYAHSADGGVAFSQPYYVAADSGRQNQDFPSIAVDSSGNPFICWIDDREVSTSGHTQLYFTRSIDGGGTFLQPVRASDMPDAKGGSCECCNTSIAVSPGGNVFISFRGNVNDNRDIYVSRSLDGGATFHVYQAATESWYIPACPMTGSSICIDRDQTAHVVWRDSRPSANGKDYIYYASLRRDQEACPPDRRISDSPKKSNYPSLTITPSGTLICAYQDNRFDQADIFYTTSLDGGASFGPGVRLSRESGSSMQEMPALRVAPDGSRCIVWQDNRRDEGDIILARDTTTLMPASSVDDISRDADAGISVEVDRAGQRLIVHLSPHSTLETIDLYRLDGRLEQRVPTYGATAVINGAGMSHGVYIVRAGASVVRVSIVW